MALSLNRIMLIGRLGKDAETRFTTSNISITSFTLATDYGHKSKEGNWINETTWHNVVAFSVSDYTKEILKKGKKVYVEGRLSKRDYTDKEGIKRYMTEVVTDRIVTLEGKEGAGESAGHDYSREAATVSDQHVSEPINNPVDENDDLPF
ncbi:MAG: single-stranded DNA-binding protein [Ignavibacteria bacterium]